MAKIIKCCTNPDCSVYHKKSAYLDDDKYCIKCGQELYHVCKGKDTDEGKPCFTVLDNGKQKYCLRCETVIEQRKEETAQKAKDILNWNPEYTSIDDIVSTAWKWHKELNKGLL